MHFIYCIQLLIKSVQVGRSLSKLGRRMNKSREKDIFLIPCPRCTWRPPRDRGRWLSQFVLIACTILLGAWIALLCTISSTISTVSIALLLSVAYSATTYHASSSSSSDEPAHSVDSSQPLSTTARDSNRRNSDENWYNICLTPHHS